MDLINARKMKRVKIKSKQLGEISGFGLLVPSSRASKMGPVGSLERLATNSIYAAGAKTLTIAVYWLLDLTTGLTFKFVAYSIFISQQTICPYYHYRYSALGPVWAEARAQSGYW
jgi:hypothetical protein